MYKDKVLQKEAVKKAVQKHRGITTGITEEGITGQGITYYPIIHALSDPIKRAKIRKVCESLKNQGRHGYLDDVFYGIGKYSMPMSKVGELLEAFD